MIQTDGNIQSWQQDIEKWKTDLAFCWDEVKILMRYLNDVNEQSLTSYMREDVSHFKARLADTMENAEVMLHDVMLYGNKLLSKPFNEENATMHSSYRERMNTFCKSYVALKSSFVRFLAKSELLIS